MSGAKPVTEAMGYRKVSVEERRALAEAIPKGVVDGAGERMPA